VSFVPERWNTRLYFCLSFERDCGGWSTTFISSSKIAGSCAKGRVNGLCSVADDFSIRQLNIHFMFVLRTTFFHCRKEIYRSETMNSLEPSILWRHMTDCSLSCFLKFTKTKPIKFKLYSTNIRSVTSKPVSLSFLFSSLLC
jgi:hypothetical protein